MPRARPGTSARLPSPLPNLLVLTPLGDAIPRTRYHPRSGCSSLDRGMARRWIPRLAVRVPADQHVRGDERGDPLQLGPLAGPVDPELTDERSLEEDRSSGSSRFVRHPCRRPETEQAAVEEGDARPCDISLVRQCCDARAEDVVSFTAHGDDLPNRILRACAHSSRSPPSNARTAVRSSSGTGEGRRAAPSTSTSVCCAVTISVSSGSR